MWPFRSAPIVITEKHISDAKDLVSLTEVGKVTEAINQTIEQAVKSIDYYSYYEKTGREGNYFGTEFDIQATATRIKSAFTREPWVWATAQLIARTLVSIPFVVKNTQTKEIDEKHPLNQKLKLTNKIQDNTSMNWAGYLDLVLGGNYFLVFDEKYQEAMHVPVECVNLILQDVSSTVPTVTITNPTTAVQKEVPYENMVHFKYPNPFNPYYGISLYIAASRPIILERYKNEFEMGFYLKGATHHGVIETSEDISKTRLERLMRTYEQTYTGRRNWWRTIFLPKGAKWVSSGLTMTEMQHLEGLRENRLSFLAAIGVPPSKVGIVQDVNRSTSEDQDKTFYENTIVPLAMFVAAGWNNSNLVKNIYSGKVYVEPDFSNIEALQGSLIKKGEKAKAVLDTWTIDEIRKNVYGMEPIGDERGSKLVAEIKSSSNNPLGQLSAEPIPTITPGVITETSADKPQLSISDTKTQAIDSQERIEKRFRDDYAKGYSEYISEMLTVTEHALVDHKDVEKILKENEKHLGEVYAKATGVTLVKAMERGFSFANTQVKEISNVQSKAFMGKRKRISEVDQQAIDYLKEEQIDGKRATLVRRALESFKGFNETRTKEILDMISSGLEEGLTYNQIAAKIREDYQETYKDQAHTVARTEILSAISQGISWNHEVLKEVFSEVQKQWFHVGDVGTNPDARMQHYEFEQEGAVESDHKWGGVLEYPRDPNAGADQVINCRCSMVSVIPDSAYSNADVILAKD